MTHQAESTWKSRPRTALALLSAGLAALVIAACGGGGGGGTPPADKVCDLSGAAVTTHAADPTGSETWASGIHRVTTSLTVPAGATLTVAACSRVEMAADAHLNIEGGLVLAGTPTAPVDVVPAAAGQPWGALWLRRGATADLAYANLTGGGGSTPTATSDTLGAPLYAVGRGDTPVKVSHVTVEGATGVGVALINAGFAAGSTALTVHGSGAHPVYIGADGLGTLPDGTYAGNGVDAIALQTAYYSVQQNDRPILQDTHIRDVGVPYCVGMVNGADIVIGQTGSAPPLVTIDAGVNLNFTKGRSGGGRLYVAGEPGRNTTQALGAIVALGTADKPVVFGSCEAAPAPGDWIGLRLYGVDPRTRLDHVLIRHAGADSSASGTCTNSVGTFDADAALQIAFSGGAPTASFLSHSSITASAGNGIFRGWQGPDVDFLASNTVSGVAWCTQTWVPDESNACPRQRCPTAP